MLGRTRPALAALGRLFAEGLIGKTYWAVVVGGPAEEQGEIVLPVAKASTRAGGWRMRPDPRGMPARTRWAVLGRGAGLAWLALTPGTGRTHQLRVHCAAAGFPILGDALYGHAAPAGLQLLARRIAIPGWEGRAPVSAEAPVPGHMRGPLAACGWRE